MTRFLYLIIVLFFGQMLLAQENDTISLDVIVINGKHFPFEDDVICPYPVITTSISRLDIKNLPTRRLTTTEHNLSDYLQSQNIIFLKTYGLGSLSTPSTRGTNANHTTILWNGINLQSPMNGTLDFSLVPSGMIDDLSYNKNGGSARYGSGAIGGSISLNNPISFRKELETEIKLEGGSFENFAQLARVKWSNGKFYNQSRIFNHSATNNFSYKNKNLFGEPTVKQSNAALSQNGFLQENAFKINKKQRIDGKLWYQNSHRQIAPSSIQGASVAFQDDKFTRSLLHWQLIDEKTAWHFTTAYFDEYLRYNDANILLDDTSRSQSWINQLEAFIYLPKQHQIKIGVNYSRFKAFSEGYEQTYIRNQFALYGDYQWISKNNDWTVQASLREDVVDNQLNPLVGSLRASYQINNSGKKHLNWFINGDINRSFRLPTFNDLYWAVGGNPDLEPEKGWSEELSLSVYSDYKSKIDYNFSFGIFNKNVNNMIVWTPSGGIWTPSNVTEIWARGLNARFYINDLKIGKQWTFGTFGRYDFTRSTNRKVNNPNALNQQLIYVPIHRANLTLTASYKKINFQYIQNFTSKRFTATDNARSIDAYSTGDILFSYRYFYKTSFHFHLKINNIWNADYEIIESRPMPQRYFQTGISVFFNKN